MRCRNCGRAIDLGDADGGEHYPFCSERCRLADLNAWLDQAYRLPVNDPPDTDGELENSNL